MTVVRARHGLHPAPRPSRGAFSRTGGHAANARGLPPAPRPSRRAFSHAGGHAASARGFTLLEVLVAFALLAIGLGLLLAILSDGVRSVASSSQSTQATLYAENLLTTLGSDRRLKPGHSQGAFEDRRYRWTLDIKVFKPPMPAPAPATADPYATGPNVQAVVDNVMLRVLLQMQWGSGPGQTLRVDTLRAYTPDQDGQQ